MSTTINVTVDDGGLPAKNRQQTAANRQAFVQGRASQQAAQQGADQRAADRRAAGLDPATGRPLASAGASSRLPRIQQEPAANRRGGVETWTLYVDTMPNLLLNGAFINIRNHPYTVHNAKPVGDSLARLRDGQLTSASPELSFSPEGGPFNQSYVTSTYSNLWDMAKRQTWNLTNNFQPLAKASNKFTVEFDGRAEGRRLFNTCSLRLYTTPSIASPFYSIAFTSTPFSDRDRLLASIFYFTSEDAVLIADINVNLPVGTSSPLAGSWSQFCMVLSDAALTIFVGGIPVASSVLTQPIPAATYSPFVEITIRGEDNISNTIFSAGSSISSMRFTAKDRYAGSYTPSPIIKP
jgi:hypothetical protein